jgi:pantoate--beta-alanine ligase
MKTIAAPRAVREEIDRAKRGGATVGFVPTMGALHEGHASLVRLARARTGFVAASIFVNPKQFGAGEDLARYPRSLDRDAELLASLGVDLLFAPGERDLYSPRDRTRVFVEGLSNVLCGAARPGHFDGVVLVVAKLLNIVRPDEAYFGQKDAQQAVIVQRMAADLDVPVRIVIGATVREADGLAMSSRNAYLDADARRRASALYGAIAQAKRRVEAGERSAAPLAATMERRLLEAGFGVDYAAIVDGETLRPVEEIRGTVLIACAGALAGTRLIDNVALRVDGGAVEEVLLAFPEWSRYG